MRTARASLPLLLLAALVAVPGAAVAAPPADAGSPVEAVVGAALAPSSLEADLHHLCDRIGGRPTGSAAMGRAVDWAAERFRSAGADRVALEPFEMPLRWEEGRTTLRLLRPEEIPLPAVSIAWSPATAAGGLEAPVLDLGEGSEADWERLGEAASGAILLVRQEVMRDLEGLFEEYLRSGAIVRQAARAGAAAVLFQASQPRGLLYRYQLTFDGLAPLPAVIVAREAAARMAALLETGEPVRARLDLPNRIGPAFSSRNVVADVTGRERPEEMVIVGAHLDSWDLGTGALDNGANSVMLIDAVRAIVASGMRPRRTIRFVLFSGEEQGLIGSRAYVRDHHDELDRISAVLIYDTGVARIRGYHLGGRPELEAPLRDALGPIESLGVVAHDDGAFAGTDHFDFLLEGVPNLVAMQDTSSYIPEYHAASDTADKVDLRELRMQVAIAAGSAFGIAELEGPLGARLDAAGVATVIRERALRAEMEAFSLWEDYVAGRRGRKPPADAFPEE